MQKYFLHLSYHGAAYHGWQRQKTAISVQATIEDGLSKFLKKTTTIHGCGRTDTGVHASGYVAHFYHMGGLPDQFIYKMNRILPEDITIHRVVDVPVEVNAQKSAIARTYHYHFHTAPDVFLADTSWGVFDTEINLDQLSSLRQILINQKEYRIFCKQPDKHKSTICRIDHFDVIEKEAGKYYLEITANRFLRSMIRLLTPVVIDILSDRISIKQLQYHLKDMIPIENMSIAPPEGLFLVDVEYDF